MSRIGSNGCQKEFVKMFSSISGRYSRHEIWQDFIWLTACAISNAVDCRFAGQRETRYLEIMRKYNPNEADVFSTLFALTVSGIDEDSDQDFLGELYMSLELGNGDAGQFFTPYDICMCMSEITVEGNRVRELINQKGYISICDPACGAGATLISAANTIKRLGINYQQHVIFMGQDIDYTVGLMCYIQLSLLGCAGYVKIGNTLTEPMTGRVLFGNPKDAHVWYTPMSFSGRWTMLRAAEEAKMLMSTVTAMRPAAQTYNLAANVGIQDKLSETISEQHISESSIPIIVAKKVKRGSNNIKGQLMFDV